MVKFEKRKDGAVEENSLVYGRGKCKRETVVVMIPAIVSSGTAGEISATRWKNGSRFYREKN